MGSAYVWVWAERSSDMGPGPEGWCQWRSGHREIPAVATLLFAVGGLQGYRDLCAECLGLALEDGADHA